VRECAASGTLLFDFELAPARCGLRMDGAEVPVASGIRALFRNRTLVTSLSLFLSLFPRPLLLFSLAGPPPAALTYSPRYRNWISAELRGSSLLDIPKAAASPRAESRAGERCASRAPPPLLPTYLPNSDRR
jgi:hypothetical protein